MAFQARPARQNLAPRFSILPPNKALQSKGSLLNENASALCAVVGASVLTAIFVASATGQSREPSGSLVLWLLGEVERASWKIRKTLCPGIVTSPQGKTVKGHVEKNLVLIQHLDFHSRRSG